MSTPSTNQAAAPIAPSPTDGYTVNGEHYPTLASLASAFGIKTTTLARRLKSPHWSLEQACGLTAPPTSAANQGKALTVRQKDGSDHRFTSMAAACLAYGVKVEVYHARRRTGWTIEQALGIDARPAQPRPGAKSWTIGGKTYFSLRRACEAHNQNADRVRSRLSMGWSLDEAFDLAPRQPPAAVPAELRRGDTGTIIICGKPFIWKSSSIDIPELESLKTAALVAGVLDSPS